MKVETDAVSVEGLWLLCHHVSQCLCWLAVDCQLHTADRWNTSSFVLRISDVGRLPSVIFTIWTVLWQDNPLSVMYCGKTAKYII